MHEESSLADVMGVDQDQNDGPAMGLSWEEIVSSIESLAEKSKAAAPRHDFHALALERLIVATGCQAGRIGICGAYWRDDIRQAQQSWDDGDWILSASSATLAGSEAGEGCEFRLNQQVFEQVVASPGPVRFPEPTASVWRTSARVDGEPVAILELVEGPQPTAEQRHGTEQLLTVVSDLVADHARAEHLRLLRLRERFRRDLDRFVVSIHESLRLDRVTYSIVNLGRLIVGGDRMSLLLADGKKFRVAAVSGIDTLDRRSQAIIEMEREATSYRNLARMVWVDGSTCNQHSISTGTRPDVRSQAILMPRPAMIGYAPLHHTQSDGMGKPQVIAVLRIDWFDPLEEPAKETAEMRLKWLIQHASQAVSNSLQSQRSARWIPASIRGVCRVWTAVLSVVVLALIAALVWVDADFKIEARGSLQPTVRQTIFAPRSATVLEFPFLTAADAAQEPRVHSNEVIVRLESPDLQYELTTLLGEQATIAQQLDTLAVSLGQLGQFGFSASGSRERFDEMTAQSLELRVRYDSLAERIGLLKSEQQRLDLRSAIGGQVITWDFTRKLRGRPVSQGDRLLEIADIDGPWQLELFVPDHHFGYITDAANQSQEPLALTFMQRSDPTLKHVGQLQDIGRTTEVFPEYGPSVRVIAAVDPKLLAANLRPGTTVVATIDCGKRSLGFVWLHDLWETLRLRMLF